MLEVPLTHAESLLLKCYVTTRSLFVIQTISTAQDLNLFVFKTVSLQRMSSVLLTGQTLSLAVKITSSCMLIIGQKLYQIRQHSFNVMVSSQRMVDKSRNVSQRSGKAKVNTIKLTQCIRLFNHNLIDLFSFLL